MNPFEIRLELLKLASQHLWKKYDYNANGLFPTGADVITLAKELDRFVSTPTRADR